MATPAGVVIRVFILNLLIYKNVIAKSIIAKEFTETLSFTHYSSPHSAKQKRIQLTRVYLDVTIIVHIILNV